MQGYTGLACLSPRLMALAGLSPRSRPGPGEHPAADATK
jgi:hypothetical protein